MTIIEDILEGLKQEVDRATKQYESLKKQAVASLTATMDSPAQSCQVADFIEYGRTLLNHECRMNYWYSISYEVQHMMKEQGKTLIQALDEEQTRLMDEITTRGGSINNSTCPLDNTCKIIRLRALTEVYGEFRGVVKYAKRQILG